MTPSTAPAGPYTPALQAAVERLIEREFLVRLDFVEPLLGSRPTASIAARWLHTQEKAAVARELRQGSARRSIETEAGTPAAIALDAKHDVTEAADELAEGYLASSTADEAETDAGDTLNITGFSASAETGRLHLWDFQVMGFLKGAASALDMKVAGKRVDAISANRQVQLLTWVFGVDGGNSFDRQIALMRGDDYITEPDGLLDRPLRAMTPKGERVSIAVSEKIDPPASASLRVVLLRGNKLSDAQVEDLFAFSMFQGLGQWRSGGWGRAIATVERVR